MHHPRFVLVLSLGLCALVGAARGDPDDEAPPAPAPLARGDLEVPPALWERLAGPTGRLGTSTRALGYTADEMAHLRSGSRHVLGRIEGLFRDVRRLPRYSGKLTGQLLCGLEDPGGLIRTGFYALGTSAGRGAEAPARGTWGFDWLEDEADPRVALAAVLERVARPDATAEERKAVLARVEEAGCSDALLRLVVQVLVAAEEARPWLAAARREDRLLEALGETDPDAATTARLLQRFGAPWIDAEGPAGAAFEALDDHEPGFLALGSIYFARCVHAATSAYAETAGDEETSSSEAVVIPTRYGDVVIGGSGDDAHAGGAWLVVDPAGDDVYTGRQAMPPSLASSIGCVLDLEGDDRYETDEAAGPCLAVFGAALLVDCSGADTYRCAGPGLASAYFGTALLLDLDGDDVYEATDGEHAQGAAHAGIGILADAAGNDTYRAVSGAQGYGGTLGFGAVVDVAGDDRYEGSGRHSEAFHEMVTLVQGIGMGRRADFGDGVSLGGGIGVLADGAGDDAYVGRVYAQGAGYWWGLGICEDRAGNDTYESQWYSLGSAPHFALGCFVDLTGDDRYAVGYEQARCQRLGCARDGAMAVFLEGEGNDEYWLRNRCGGSADLNSIALFWERAGDDRYTVFTDGSYRKDPSLGAACTYPEPFGTFRDDMPTIGLFLDSGGRDHYECRRGGGDTDIPPFEAGDGLAWRYHDGPALWGLGLDLDWFRADGTAGAPSPWPDTRPVTRRLRGELQVPWPGDARADLEVPGALWKHVLALTGHEGAGELGYSADEMANFRRGTEHVLPLVERAFRRVPRIPAWTGRVSDRLLRDAATPSALSALAWQVIDAGAGRGVEVSADVAALPELDEADLPPCVRTLAARLVAAAREAAPWARAAVPEPLLRAHFGVDDLDEVDRDALYFLAAHPFYEGLDSPLEDPVPDAFRLLDVFDRRAMSMATAVFLRHVEAALDEFEKALGEPGSEIRRTIADLRLEGGSLVLPTAVGRLRIADARPQTHEEGDALLVDLGGDDAYRGRHAAPLSLSENIGLVIDLSGNDDYRGGGDPVSTLPEESVVHETEEGLRVRTPDDVTWEAWTKASAKWRLAIVKGELHVSGRDVEAPPGETVRVDDATRVGLAIHGVDEATVALFCWERRAFQLFVVPAPHAEGGTPLHELLVLAEDGDALRLREGAGNRAALASGLFGIGVLIDLEGNDAYTVRRSGLGEGLYGFGLLLDRAGDDVYTVQRDWGQGVGHAGIGVLADLAGDDVYRTGSTSQGYGGTLGGGLLVDVAGDDRYEAHLDGRRQGIYRNQSVSFVQGSSCGRRADFGDGRSLGGGVGLLVDGAGDDHYRSGAYGQGNAYWFGLGACEDRGGNDTYEMMQYGLGSSPHFGIGVMVDLSGDDAYNVDAYVMQRVMGHGRDGAIGIFMDGDGDDRYRVTSDSVGYADLNSLALFWDRRGDDDYRILPTRAGKVGFGSAARYEAFGTFRDDMAAVGVFLDTGGTDTYRIDPSVDEPETKGPYVRGANDTEWFANEAEALHRWGYGIDIDLYAR